MTAERYQYTGDIFEQYDPKAVYLCPCCGGETFKITEMVKFCKKDMVFSKLGVALVPDEKMDLGTMSRPIKQKDVFFYSIIPVDNMDEAEQVIKEVLYGKEDEE
jgi:hypothetical protein